MPTPVPFSAPTVVEVVSNGASIIQMFGFAALLMVGPIIGVAALILRRIRKSAS
jgi:hypothetical protein